MSARVTHWFYTHPTQGVLCSADPPERCPWAQSIGYLENTTPAQAQAICRLINELTNEQLRELLQFADAPVEGH